jgi:hypothetical protein
VFFEKAAASRASHHPSTPSQEEPTARPDTSAGLSLRLDPQLAVPSNLRATRPARIDISTGPTHLHSSYLCSRVSGVPLSPPPSAARSNFDGSSQLSHDGSEEPAVDKKVEDSSVSRGDAGKGDQLGPSTNPR